MFTPIMSIALLILVDSTLALKGLESPASGAASAELTPDTKLLRAFPHGRQEERTFTSLENVRPMLTKMSD